MWEEWRFEIDRSLREAQLTERRWREGDIRADLREGTAKGRSPFRLLWLGTRRGTLSGDRATPTARLGLGASRARPIL